MITNALDRLQSAPQPGPGGGLIQFLPMIFIFVIFYFLLIAPMRKRQKRQQAMLTQLKKGDEVVTSGGIFGRISAFDETHGAVILQIGDNVKVKVLRSAISGPASEPEAATPTAPGS
ncbi:MAG TPA: preprotein translocase subunit YajC [Thermoanaerobaculia bacterium]|jgi:preprotein translocase subunit YajC|nr:preprotein translocase subunit YajC [Thermoanaerobaculia bacterium]